MKRMQVSHPGCPVEDSSGKCFPTQMQGESLLRAAGDSRANNGVSRVEARVHVAGDDDSRFESIRRARRINISSDRAPSLSERAASSSSPGEGDGERGRSY